MFAFHRPKIYRSANGCCICRAKSSSSRFTGKEEWDGDRGGERGRGGGKEEEDQEEEIEKEWEEK